MIIMGIILTILGIFKLIIIKRINWEGLEEELMSKLGSSPVNVIALCDIVNGILMLDGLISLACGAYIVFA